MPSIPRRSQDADEARPPEEQRTEDASAASPIPPLGSGDPLATPMPDPAEQPTTAAPAVDPAAQTDPAPPLAPESGGATAAVPAGPLSRADAPPAAAHDPLPGDGAPPAAVLAPEGEQAPVDARPRFRERTRMRRRLRYLRRLRELAVRDLGGLVFDLHRFGRDRNDLVAAKLEALATIDRELRALEEALADRRDFTDLREAGIAACPRCATLHWSDANFCPGCGTPLRGTVLRSAGAVTIAPADEPAVAPPTEPQRRHDEPPAAAPAP